MSNEIPRLYAQLKARFVDFPALDEGSSTEVEAMYWAIGEFAERVRRRAAYNSVMFLSQEQRERAARKLCQMRGINPDERPQLWGGVDILEGSPLWTEAAREIDAALARHQALSVITEIITEDYENSIE